MTFKQRLRQFVAPDFLIAEEPMFTLDHNGGLVVSLDVILESGRLDRQFEGVARLRALHKARAGEGNAPAHPHMVRT